MTEDSDKEDREDDDPFEAMEQAGSPPDGDPFSELAESYDGSDEGNKADAGFTAGDPFVDSSLNTSEHDETETVDGEELSDEPVFHPSPSEQDHTAPTGDTDLFMDSVSRSGDPFESGEGLFESTDIETVDPDSIWRELSSVQSEDSGRQRVRTYADVSKHAFCEQCEHFSKPPDVSCNHDGTEIVEFRDMETVRLIDCPIVAERKALEADATMQEYKSQ